VRGRPRALNETRKRIALAVYVLILFGQVPAYGAAAAVAAAIGWGDEWLQWLTPAASTTGVTWA
jgi:hypothetical protein